ncbi:DUF2271 domain-containing protein [Wenyingzhuangia marina]|uniref:Flagellin biosynthesis protein FlgD n=1 Tax=Wenyingzhuangia marina TaxID=1195760 RepID=A0A1M5T586_9FLAO|nr:DUF2271 domain-containing protein [Wenyingzhuangia marina]GGF65423.1 Tat pathway signal protein [Wenyingzhuangia marina]SHH45931.1 Predicted protein [Wenyingzhuangia marina]
MKIYKSIFYVCSLFLLVAFTTVSNITEPTKKYKCMVQLKNYEGEGAYVVVSVVDKNDQYLKTVQILGDDKKWYADLSTWWSFFEKAKQPNTDAITGATIAGGERSIFVFQLNEKDLNKGYKLRFETAVEQQDYHLKDLEISLDNNNLKDKHEGTGYIRYVRILPN